MSISAIYGFIFNLIVANVFKLSKFSKVRLVEGFSSAVKLSKIRLNYTFFSNFFKKLILLVVSMETGLLIEI